MVMDVISGSLFLKRGDCRVGYEAGFRVVERRAEWRWMKLSFIAVLDRVMRSSFILGDLQEG